MKHEIGSHARHVWVLARIKDTAIAVPATQIREMIALDQQVALQRSNAEVRGIINLRGHIVKLIDLRVLMGETSAPAELDELCCTLTERKLDHERWLETLERSIRESLPFALARDPRQCAFGKWYYSFHSDNAVLRTQLAKVERPHRAIHELAATALAMADGGRHDEALQMLNHARRTTLHELIGLLDGTRALLRTEHREIVLVLDCGTQGIGVIVDEVIAVHALKPADVASASARGLGEVEQMLLGFAQLDGQSLLMLDLERALAWCSPNELVTPIESVSDAPVQGRLVGERLTEPAVT